MKFGYFVRPHLGGTYSVYTNLRRGLARQGIEVQWIGLGDPPGKDASSEQALEHGFFFAPRGALSEREQAAALVETIEQHGFDGVFINVLAERMQMNLARYLPADILRIMIVHSITPATYAAARAIRESVHATVAVSERARHDLVHMHGFQPECTLSIANAVDVEAVGETVRRPSADRGLRLLFLGRLDDVSKGVFWLPDIMDRLSVSTSLTIAGDGPDAARLQEKLARFGSRVTFLGPVPHERVAGLLEAHDVLVMPSRFEGSPVTLIEATAAGCVPVVSRIVGVTDRIVKQGVSGLLFPVGDWREAARQIRELEEKPLLLSELSSNARRQAREGHGLEAMALAYSKLIDELRRAPTPIARPEPLEHWTIPAGFRPGFRTYLPRPVKNWLRLAIERL